MGMELRECDKRFCNFFSRIVKEWQMASMYILKTTNGEKVDCWELEHIHLALK